MKTIPAIVVTVAMMLCTSLVAASNETVLIQQNFGDKTLFESSDISPAVRAAGTGGIWNGFDNANFSIVDIAGVQGDRALKITRVKSGILSVHSPADVPNNRNVIVRMRVRVGRKDESAGVIRFVNRKRNAIVTNVRFEGNNSVAGYLDGKRHFGLKTRPEEWQVITFRFSPNAERFDLAVEYADGTTLQGTPVPFENNVPIDTIEFSTYPATNKGGDNTILIDDINVTYENTSSLNGRDNVLSSAYNTKAFIIAADGIRHESSRLNDGVVDSTSVEAIAGFPSILQFDLSQSTLVSTVRLFTGNADYVDNPSGEVAVTAFMVEGMSSASGQWRELLTVNDVPGFRATSAKDNESFYITCDFEPLEVSQLRVTLLDSNDTGRRAVAGEKVIKTTLVREVELYTHEATAGRRKQLATVLSAEFALPAYRDERIAQLHASLSNDLPDGIEVEVSVRDRQTGHEPETTRRVKLNAGEARIDFDIAGWPDGEYRVQLQAAGLDAPVGGTLARLLRINRLDAPVVPTDLGDFSGKRMFFPDARNLASQSNIDIRQGCSQVHRVGRTFLKPDKVVQLGSDIGFTSDEKLVVIFRDMNREWKVESSEVHYATADLTNLDKWEIYDGKPTDIDTTSAGPANRRVRIGRGVDLTADDMQRMRFYDPARDGPVDLKELLVQYAGYKKADWGVVQPPPQSTWLLWKKGNEWLILQDKPFLQDNLSADEFELPTNSNDNFAGQWLSDDGKTFFYVRGRLLKRYPPFVARYDNLWQAARILTVFTTNDGLTWRQQYFPLPTEKDGPTAQHYGAHIREIPNSNGLMISYTLLYSALMQQMHLELDYSWDGKSWYRSPGGKPWVRPGQPDEWNFGLTNLHAPVIERNGLSYHLIGWGAEIPHFGGEILFKPAEMEKLSGIYLQQRYGERGLADWPFFKHYGSFDRLAESLRGYGITPGVMVYRTDGWWALTASGDEGSFTTLPLRAKGTLTANARIAADGYIAVTLTDRDGVPINGYSAQLTASDSTALPVFEHLPTNEFRVSITLKNAELFTLNF